MPASGSCIYTDVAGYQASLRDTFDLLVPRPRDFWARLTWVELPSLRLLRAQEASPRVAYVTLPPELVFVTFPTQQNSALIYRGAELQFGDIVLHSQGECLHQRTTAPTNWGSISLAATCLLTFGQTIAGRDLIPPREGQVLRPGAGDRQRLLRLHAQAGRLAEASLTRLTNKEVVRALEQDLIWALITCLTNEPARKDQAIGRAQSGMLIQLEALLAQCPFRLLRTRDICSSLRVSERALRASCSAELGMSPGHYQRLRRLKLARAELLRANPMIVSSIEVVERYGFADLHRFVAEYWDVYGEMPPTPPRDTAKRRE